MGIGKAMTWL